MKWKILTLLSVIFMILIVSSVSAFEFDNIRNYDTKTKTVTITNAFGLPLIGNDIATIKLNTPINNIVPRGYQKVAEFTIYNYDNYSNVFNNMELFDLKNKNTKFTRNFDYKYKVISQVPDYQTVCDDSFSKNGTAIKTNCREEQNGVKDKTEWINIDSTKGLEKGWITIGIFTDVKKGDKVEWIPTLFGERISEWAIWTESLNAGLISYWAMENPSGSITDSVSSNDLAPSGSPLYGQTGIIGSAIGFNSNDDFFSKTGCSNLDFGLTQDFTINLWLNRGFDATADRRFIQSATVQPFYLLSANDGNTFVSINTGGGADRIFLSLTEKVNDGEWYMFTFIRNNSGTDLWLYYNGVLNVSATSQPTKNASCEELFFGDLRGDRFVNTSMDEVGVWNRTLSQSKITQLYNGGAGISYTDVFNPPTINLDSPVNNTNFTLTNNIIMNATIFDDTNITKVSLIIDDVYNETNTTSGLNNTVWTFNKIMEEGDFFWTMEVCDSDGLCANASQRTFNVNTTPNIQYGVGVPVNEFNLTTANFFEVNVTITEDLFKNITFDLYNVNGALNQSVTFTNSSRNKNWTNLPDATYSYNVTVATTTNQFNSTGTRNISIDINSPIILITAPSTDVTFHEINTNLFVNWSISDTNLDTCILEYENTNTTLTCSSNTTNINITTISNRTITIYANDTFGKVNSSSRTWDYTIFQNSLTYDSSIFETANGTFSINVTANSSLTNTDLVYNGTTYSTTKNVDLYTTSFDIPTTPGSETFYWDFTYAGGRINSSTNTQEINTLFFQYCNATLSTPFLNFTFKDETDNSDLNVTNDLVDTTFWIGGGTETKSYINSTTSDSNYYDFCSNAVSDTITIDSIFKYSKTGYPLRTFAYIKKELTNITTNQILYLLATADGIYSSITVIETSGGTIQGVGIQVERQFAGVWTVISQDTTGSDGVATFWVNPNFPHRITATKTAYVTAQVTITPSQTLYTLTLQKTTGNATFVSDLPGIKWIAFPQSGSIDVGTRSFNVTVTSSESNLENCKFELVNDTNLSHTLDSVTSFTNSSYCFLEISYNAQANNNFFGRLSLDTLATTGFVIVDSDWKWIVIDIDAKSWRSITSFFSDLKTLSEFGEGNEGSFSRIITFFLLTTIFFGVFIYITGVELTSPGVTILLIWGITLFASAGGFLTFNSGSGNINPMIEQWGFVFIFTIFMINYFLTILRKANE